MNKKIILAVLLIAGVAVGADAQTIRGKAYNEQYRIAEGARNGSLTRGEAYRLEREQRNIHRDIRRSYRNDGHIGPYERANIRREERRANRDIYRDKHNGRYHW